MPDIKEILSNARKTGRNLVLPVNSIKYQLQLFINQHSINKAIPILDFGAGTLFWTNIFKGKRKSSYTFWHILKNP